MNKEAIIKRLKDVIRTCKLKKEDISIREEYAEGYYDGTLILAEEIFEYLKGDENE